MDPNDLIALGPFIAAVVVALAVLVVAVVVARVLALRPGRRAADGDDAQRVEGAA